MIIEKLSQLKQDLTEVKGKLEDLENTNQTVNNSYISEAIGNLEDVFSILEEHLKEHIEDTEIFIGRTS